MSAAVEAGGFDEIAQRAVLAAEEPGAVDETEEIRSKSERIMRPSMAVSMFRGRRHISCNVDPGNIGEDVNDADEPMDIKPLEASAFVPPDEVVADFTGPDRVMVWKADVLRALRGAEDGTMTLAALQEVVSNPGEAPYADQLEEHVISRNLAKWVLANESIQLVTV